MLSKQLFPLANEKSWQSLLIKDGTLYLINDTFKTEEAFLDSYEKKGLFKKKKEAPIGEITKMSHEENAPLKLEIEATSGDFFLQFRQSADLVEVANYLQEQRQFTAQTATVGTFKAISPQLISLGVTALFTWLLWMDATAQESGEVVNTSGRRAGMKMLLAWVAEMLGSTGSLAAGSIVALIFIFLLWKKLQNPPNEVVYQ